MRYRVAYLGDVTVDSRYFLVGILEEDLRECLYPVEVIIDIDIVQFVRLVLETHGEVNHQFAFLVIVSHFGRPIRSRFHPNPPVTGRNGHWYVSN